MHWIDKKIYDTYHSKKNKEGLLTVVIISAFCLILHDALGMEILVWTCYYLWCKKNDYDLEHDENNLEERQRLLNLKMKLINEGKYPNN